jgi:uncharacterized Fe-S cluster-containing MiaB family protein
VVEDLEIEEHDSAGLEIPNGLETQADSIEEIMNRGFESIAIATAIAILNHLTYL